MYKDLKRAFVAIEQTVCFFFVCFLFVFFLFVLLFLFLFFCFFAVVVIVFFSSKTDCKIGPGNADTVLKWQG